MIDDEMERYIRFKFIQIEHDYKKSKDPIEVFEVEAKNCEANDFTESVERNK